MGKESCLRPDPFPHPVLASSAVGNSGGDEPVYTSVKAITASAGRFLSLRRFSTTRFNLSPVGIRPSKGTMSNLGILPANRVCKNASKYGLKAFSVLPSTRMAILMAVLPCGPFAKLHPTCIPQATFPDPVRQPSSFQPHLHRSPDRHHFGRLKESHQPVGVRGHNYLRALGRFTQ